MYKTKRKLVELVFDNAKKELQKTKVSKSFVATYLSSLFEEKYNLRKDERTFVRYYTKLVEENANYTIDDITLDTFSAYIGYTNFNEFCKYYKKDPIVQTYGSVQIAISENNDGKPGSSDDNSKVSIHITNAPVFTIPEFLTKDKNSLGIIGVFLLLGGVFADKSDYFKEQNETTAQNTAVFLFQEESQRSADQSTFVHVMQPINKTIPSAAVVKQKECMYWNIDHYEAVFCDEKISGAHIVAINEEDVKLFKQINRLDTLTVENAIGRVWYDKSNNRLEFFTSHGLHPLNGKTLKPISKHIIEKYLLE